MKIYSFRKGGLVLEDPSTPPATESTPAFLPSIAVVPLIQHPGEAAVPLVSVGDRVSEGMLIGRGKGAGSAHIHSPIPGRVIRKVSWTLADGRLTEGLVIRLEGSFTTLGHRKERYHWDSMSPADLLRTFADKGLVEMEEPGKPLYDIVREATASQQPVIVVVRMVFDDPWLVADYVLCKEHVAEIIEGARILQKATKGSRIIFTISEEEAPLGAIFEQAAAQYGESISVVYVGSRYPQRNRRELEIVLKQYERVNNELPSYHCIINPATAYAIYTGVVHNIPILERYVAVGGGAVKNPRVLRLRLGTTIGDAIAQCGGFITRPARIATGSTMKGKYVQDLDEPITKTTVSVIALTEEQIGGEQTYACINCGECRRICPVGLDPERLYKYALLEKDEEDRRYNVVDCHGCGCCEVVCPSRLPLSTVIRISIKRGAAK
ncbi:MAG: RnfABCDGE type electron transport complex subunit C [Treponemataceae bacterium]|nr:RnfABCDGE type electron transport complex subunit C [Treponemataceae bacterium]